MLLRSKIGGWGLTLQDETARGRVFDFKKNGQGDFVCDIPENIEIISPVNGKLMRVLRGYAESLLKAYPKELEVYIPKKDVVSETVALMKKRGRPKKEKQKQS